MNDVTPASIRRKRRRHRREQAAAAASGGGAPRWLKRKAKYIVLGCVAIGALLVPIASLASAEMRLRLAAGLCAWLGLAGFAYYLLRIRVPASTPLPMLRATAERMRLQVDPAGFQFSIVGDLPLEASARAPLVRAAQTDGCRIVCLTGDVVKQSNPGAWRDYLAVLQQGLAADAACFHTPGNHDIDHNLLGRDRRFFRHYFGLENYRVEAGAFDLIFLDSAELTVTEAQAQWLAGMLLECRGGGRRAIILTHTPPREPPVVDDHCLRTDATVRLAQAIEGGGVAAIFCGHWHRFFDYAWAGTRVYVGGNPAAVGGESGGLALYRATIREKTLTVEKKLAP